MKKTAKTAPKEAPMFDFSVLRDLRKQEGLTIQEASQRSGVSPAVISKLERNQTRAEMETLFRLSRTMGINVADLMTLAESRTAHKVASRRYASGDFRFERVDYGNVKCFHAAASAGARVSRPEVHRDDYELCWVLKGALRVLLPHEQHLLEQGEALQFDAVLEHTYEAVEDCEILILHLSKGKRF